MSGERERLLKLIRELSYQKREVTLSSGRKSDFYIDLKQVTLHPEGCLLVGKLLCFEIMKDVPDAVAVGGLTLGADPIAAAVAMVSGMEHKGLQGFIIRKEPKKHGTGAWIEGARWIEKGAKVVIVEDVLTTGASALNAVKRAREEGFDVRWVFAIVDREEGGREELEKEGLKLVSLFRKKDIAG